MGKTSVGPTPGFYIWRLSMKWRVAVDRAVAPLGLTHAKYSFLSSLVGMQRSGHRPSQRELADHTGLEPLYISKLARALEADGFVERAPDSVDTRAVELILTGQGRQATRQAMGIVRSCVNQLLAPLGGIEARRTTRFVRDLRALLDVPWATRGQKKGKRR